MDADQEGVILLVPPVILESGSGTGKTNVLFQHAVAHARVAKHESSTRICFITGKKCATPSSDMIAAHCFVCRPLLVSPRLRQEMDTRYSNVRKMETSHLPPIKFYSLLELLGDLLSFIKMGHIKVSELCRFADYVNARKSHEHLLADAKEAESE